MVHGQRECHGRGIDKEKSVDANAPGGAVPSNAADDQPKTIVVTKSGRQVVVRGKIENTWSHGTQWGSGFKCGYCCYKNRGGGSSRLREHLCGIRGQVSPCLNVPQKVREVLLKEVALLRQRKKESNESKLFLEKTIMEHDRRLAIDSLDEETQFQMAMRESLKDVGAFGGCRNSPFFGRSSGSGSGSGVASLGRASGSGSGAACLGRASGSGSKVGSFSASQSKLDSFYHSSSKAPFDIDLARSRAPSQPRVDIMLHGGAKERLGKAVAKWFHANDIPGRKADCPYFRSMMMLAQQLGEGVSIPKGREIDGPLLDMNYDEMKAHMASFQEDWKHYGVTIMCDSWTGPTMMCIINFMIFCNGRMFFHKTVDATGKIQNADFIYSCIREVVVDEIGEEFVVQLVTDNGSNYKKACKQLISDYPHISWQPCAAHTINLILKDISRFDEVVEVVSNAKQICRFLYKHNRLHAKMKEKIGGELIRWNATRFGTVFLFLQSFWNKQDKFKAWMVSNEWASSDWRTEEDHSFTYDCLTKRTWWEKMGLVLKAVTPIYIVLRYADQQKNGTISGFLPKMLRAVDEIRSNLRDNQDLLERVMEVIDKRLRYLLNDTLMVAAAALDPEALYRSKIAQKPCAKFDVTMALKKIASSPSKTAIAIDQFSHFSSKKGLFGGEEAKCSAISGRVNPADWWALYGGQYKELQNLATRIVSQCMSSSGCERNWSTFALVHTKLRNRLGYPKPYKLVKVHYNLKLIIQQFETDFQASQEMEYDPCSIMMDIALFDEDNPIMD